MPQEDIRRMQEEAVRRVRDMQDRARRHTESTEKRTPPPVMPQAPESPPEKQPDPPRENPPPAPAPGGFETLLRDKDRTLILSLLILLCDDDRDPGLLFALLFLLM